MNLQNSSSAGKEGEEQPDSQSEAIDGIPAILQVTSSNNLSSSPSSPSKSRSRNHSAPLQTHLSSSTTSRSPPASPSPSNARSRTESFPASSTSTSSSILPSRGKDSDAESAINKLDRMEKAHEFRRKWRTRTGVAGLVGDHRERERRRKEREEEEGEWLWQCGDVSENLM